MRTRITFDQADRMLKSRTALLDAGRTPRRLQEDERSGALVRVHRGWFVDAQAWTKLWPEGQHLLRVIAVARAGTVTVFTHQSAAVLWGLPLRGDRDVLVDALINGARHSRVAAGVARHQMVVDDDDVTVRHGILCTTLHRTVLDLARTTRLETAVSAGDAALRLVAVDGQLYDTNIADEWRTDLERMCDPGLRGIRQARWVTDFIDGRAQLPGESVSRIQLHRLGFAPPPLQVRVVGAADDEYFLDFGFTRSRVFGEFDGDGKYLEPDLRRAETPADVVLAEKRREDDIRGVTGWGFARWGNEDIRTPENLGRRLAAFGVLPPG
ncbi:hypothetical protein [Microbacterium sp. Bi121]|uniref:hypothetical protein n=1 Tax=Microbacterium sp. Bi121 TaxID=2822348 RepID=UPI001E325C3A|nr:hypothetical protein [Microbacterium sp. Bi121]